jgi:hypothetical protein
MTRLVSKRILDAVMVSKAASISSSFSYLLDRDDIKSISFMLLLAYIHMPSKQPVHFSALFFFYNSPLQPIAGERIRMTSYCSNSKLRKNCIQIHHGQLNCALSEKAFFRSQIGLLLIVRFDKTDRICTTL